ncbi:MAG: hypothetical protein GY756_22765 [bacterium]|nr:hypothetical protein [bacterium]
MNYRQRYANFLKRDPIICPNCGSEMELFRLWHSKYGIFYEGFDNLIVEPPSNDVVDNKVHGYNKNCEQLVLLS